MIKNEQEKIQNQFSEIKENILNHVDNILSLLNPLFNENQLLFLTNNENIQEIHGSALFLKQQLTVSENELNTCLANQANFQEFLAKMRHDLRNPINIIQGYSEIVLEDIEKKPIQSFIDSFHAIISAAHEINLLIDEIRTHESSIPYDSFIIPSRKHLSPFFSEAKGFLIRDQHAEYDEFKKKFHILIVDDLKENCRLLERYLNQLDYRNIYIAHNAFQALSVVEHEEIDLILLDIEMPGMSGIELLQQLKKEDHKYQLMVIMITASDTMEHYIQCIQLGAEDLLSKPFNPEMLNVRVGACLQKKWFINLEDQYREKLEMEKERYEELLNAIFPPVVVRELVSTNKIQTKLYQSVAILFTDVVNFTHYCDTHSLKSVTTNIHLLAEICENAAAKYNLQKIKTIGDGFLATAGIMTVHQNPVLDCVLCAEEILAASSTLDAKWKLRAGIDFGTIIGGIVGHHQYLFDVWSDTVNTAARILTKAEPGTLCLTKRAWEQIKEQCNAHSMGMHRVKGKKPIEIFQYENRKH